MTHETKNDEPKVKPHAKRRVAVAAATLGLALSGVAWAGCGDDETTTDATDAVDAAKSDATDATDELSTAATDATDEASTAATDATDAVKDEAGN